MAMSMQSAARKWGLRADDDDPDILERLEQIVLKHDPKSDDEAAAMLDVVAVNVSTGQRSDGLDVRAVEAVAAWLREPD